MTLESGRHYFVKLIANWTFYKFVSWSLLAFIWIIAPTDYIIFHMLLRLWVISMVFGTINWSLHHWFNIRKFCIGGAKIIVYWLLIYFAKSLDMVTHLDCIWTNIFAWFMIFELLLSVFKHCWELWLPIPKKLIDFVLKQEKTFEEKFNNWWSEKK